jgi:hypothetical protein
MKWYALGLSNASGMFDISGSMWTVSILFNLWLEKCVDTLAVAGMEPGFHLCLPGAVAEAIQCDDRGGVDQFSVW